MRDGGGEGGGGIVIDLLARRRELHSEAGRGRLRWRKERDTRPED